MLNVNGIRSKWVEVLDLVQHYDVMTFVETKIGSKVTISSLAIPGYYTFRQDRNSNGGGIITFIKDVWKIKELTKLQAKYVSLGLEVLIVQIKIGKPNKQITLVSLYRPPNSRNEWFTRLDELIIELHQLGGVLAFLGDLNADLLKADQGPTILLNRSLSMAGVTINDTSAKSAPTVLLV